MRRLRSAAILTTACLGVLMLLASTWVEARLVWNFTPSIPTGLYSIEDHGWQTGDRVALKPSGRLLEVLRTAEVLKDGRLLMKRVAASAGATVCRADMKVTINGAAAVDARPDERLPRWSGCVVLAPGEVFLLGETDNSFDGRYFGVSAAADIVGPVRSILTF